MGVFFSYKDNLLHASCRTDETIDRSEYQMHTHSGAEVFCFFGGKGVFHVEGEEYGLETGDIMIFGPSEAHYIEVDDAVPYKRSMVHLQPEMFEEIDPTGELLRPFLDKEPGKGNIYKRAQFRDGDCQHYWQIILSDVGRKHTNIVAGLVGLLHEIYRIYVNRRQEIGRVDTLEYQLVRYINMRLTQPVTLDEICAKYYISKAQLCRRFRKATGTTVWHYITVKRLVEARTRIKKGQSPTQVASELGFGDYSSFYRAYRKHWGCSPGQTVKGPVAK